MQGGGQSTNDPSATLINSVVLDVPSDVNENFFPDKVYGLEILYLTFWELVFLVFHLNQLLNLKPKTTVCAGDDKSSTVCSRKRQECSRLGSLMLLWLYVRHESSRRTNCHLN